MSFSNRTRGRIIGRRRHHRARPRTWAVTLPTASYTVTGATAMVLPRATDRVPPRVLDLRRGK